MTLQRTTRSVKLYKPQNVPQSYWAREGKTVSSKINIPSSHTLANAQAARMLAATWNGADGQGSGKQVKINNWVAPNFGADHFYSLDTVDVPVSSLNNGDNTVSFWAATIQSHGIEILWPGPGVIVNYNTRLPDN